MRRGLGADPTPTPISHGVLTRAEAEVALGKLREQVAIERADERAAEAKRATEERRRPLAQVGRR